MPGREVNALRSLPTMRSHRSRRTASSDSSRLRGGRSRSWIAVSYLNRTTRNTQEFIMAARKTTTAARRPRRRRRRSQARQEGREGRHQGADHQRHRAVSRRVSRAHAGRTGPDRPPRQQREERMAELVEEGKRFEPKVKQAIEDLKTKLQPKDGVSSTSRSSSSTAGLRSRSDEVALRGAHDRSPAPPGPADAQGSRRAVQEGREARRAAAP